MSVKLKPPRAPIKKLVSRHLYSLDRATHPTEEPCSTATSVGFLHTTNLLGSSGWSPSKSRLGRTPSLASEEIQLRSKRWISSTPLLPSPSTDLSRWYRIEANNAARSGTTQLTVVGPDIDGILASMTVALAVKGCSLVELHAAKSIDTAVGHYDNRKDSTAETSASPLSPPMINDIFYVVNRHTGMAFDDDELEPLASSLLEALKTPMNIVSVGGAMSTLEGLQDNLTHAGGHESQHGIKGRASQILVVPSTAVTEDEGGEN